tara:strand:+ start:982 stop:2595 length:1614 start_codon:yes stop_codon:yes gene_type:complete
MAQRVMTEEDAQFVGHEPCPDCGSKDNLGVWADHSYCFGCHTHTWLDDENRRDKAPFVKPDFIPLAGQFVQLTKRGLTAETCRKFEYSVATYKNQKVQIAGYRDAAGSLVAQKMRTADKQFSILGNAHKMTLFGSQLWRSGRKLVITEGEIDAMSVSQMQNHKWPVVSLPNGAASAKKALIKCWDYLGGFDEVILMFDQDEAGQNAAKECAAILPFGKAKTAFLGEYKDANEALLAGDTQAIVNAIFSAEAYRPDGIVTSDDLYEMVGKLDFYSSVAFPYPQLNEITKGIQPSTLITLGAGSGVGKSTLTRELAYHLHTSGEMVGVLMLEESNNVTLHKIIGIEMNKDICSKPDVAPVQEMQAAHRHIFSERMMLFWDHFGATDFETVKNRIRWMVASGCKFLFIDHLGIIVSGLTGQVSDERRLIDMIMTELRCMVQELNVTMFLVSHLKRPASGEYEEGTAKVTLGSLRGSHSIAQLSDLVIALNVDSEAVDADMRQLVVLKNRHTGECGNADKLRYFRSSGRLKITEEASESAF